MKFIRNLVSRREPPAIDPASVVRNQVAPFEDIIGYGEDPVADKLENRPSIQKTKASVEASRAQPVKSVTPVALPKEDPPEPVFEDDAFQPAQNAYADAAFAESKHILEKLAARLKDEEPVAKPPPADVKIWDIEDENDTTEMPAVVTQPVRPAPAKVVPQRETEIIPISDVAPMGRESTQILFPVGWLVVAGGPGRGASFPLEAGLSLIGRDPDQAVQLDFGDTSVARSNHAAVVYDPETHAFTLGHGGKKDIVRLNGKPVISNETLATGDKIRIGDTTLHFVPLCTDRFDWTKEDNTKEHAHVAIA